MGLLLGLVRINAGHPLDLEQGVELLLVLRRANLSFDIVAGGEIETTDLRRGDVDILRAGQVIEGWGTQETEAFRHDLQDAACIDDAACSQIALDDLENDLLPLESAVILDTEMLCHVGQRANGHGLQLVQVEGLGLDHHLGLLRGIRNRSVLVRRSHPGARRQGRGEGRWEVYG